MIYIQKREEEDMEVAIVIYSRKNGALEPEQRPVQISVSSSRPSTESSTAVLNEWLVVVLTGDVEVRLADSYISLT